jgi:hypothetical protein
LQNDQHNIPEILFFPSIKKIKSTLKLFLDFVQLGRINKQLSFLLGRQSKLKIKTSVLPHIKKSPLAEGQTNSIK